MRETTPPNPITAAVRGGGLLAATLGLTFSLAHRAAGNAAPAHLVWAESLATSLTPANNDYGSPTDVRWQNVDGQAQSFNRSVCATFLTTLIRRAYNLTGDDLRDWMGSSSPYAEQYHHAIAAGNGWTRISDPGNLLAGDVIAIDYRDGSSSTGHVAVASSAPIPAGEKILNGSACRVYDVWVIDSSSSYHGTADTRYLKKDGATADKGVGEGAMRLYADKQTGQVVGYSWSNSNSSTIYLQPAADLSGAGRHLVLGRL